MSQEAGQTFTPGQNVKKHRLLKGLKQEELCAGICSVSQLSKLENGKAQGTPDQWRRFAERLGMPVERLLTSDSYLERLQEQLMIAERASAARQQERALEMARAVIEQSRAHGYDDLCGEATFFAAQMSSKLLRWQDALLLLNGLLTSPHQLEVLRQGEVWCELGKAYLHGGNKAEGLRCLRKADALLREIPPGHPRELDLCCQHGDLLYELGDYRESYQRASRANRLAREQSKHLWRLRTATMMALNLFWMGEREQSYALLRSNLHEAEENQLVPEVGGSCVNLGLLYRVDGDLIQARLYLERAVTHLELVIDQHPFLSILPYVELAEVAASEGQEGRADDWLRQVQELNASVKAAAYLYESRTERIRAKLCRRRGKTKQALEWLQSALARYELHHAYEESYETAVEIAELLEEQNDPDAVEMYARAFAYEKRYKEAVGWGE
ncbi:helix-turn-helix domain-containing protein [Tumebacillus flagellatus]|uniref:HTH cro/C1-type domain-containing protein n=1 Tax=Tumebacillus flagellatus TaxID=1157490 RepID=A0A074LRD8_9BACL|nr:helix-turn-helix domain-containing protein [Tumebacillus flagellatus]KEO84686.1 hypothetical protein EL26_03980 [Tumebacillus flagellatus]